MGGSMATQRGQGFPGMRDGAGVGGIPGVRCGRPLCTGPRLQMGVGMSRVSDVAVWAPAEEGRSEGCRAPRPLTWREERKQMRRAADEGEASRARGEGGSERGADGEGRGEAEEGGP